MEVAAFLPLQVEVAACPVVAACPAACPAVGACQVEPSKPYLPQSYFEITITVKRTEISYMAK